MPETERAELLARLRQVAHNRSQAEIARRTGFPQANVHRFLNGHRVPAEFCQALAREFSVNPVWLLLGEGAPYLSDVPEGVARMGADLLELVRALSAVERMRLGSLTGKHHLRVLRELNDALLQHENLRARLNEQTRPVFGRLLDDIDRCLEKTQLEQAGDLLKAAGQVARLCDDETLALRLDGQRSFYAYLCREFELSIALQRRLFVRRLAGITQLGQEIGEHTRNFAVSLNATGRIREARRVCEAALALGRDSTGAWKLEIEVICGGMMLDLGELMAGLTRMQNAGPGAAELLWSRYSGLLVRGLLWGGLLDFDGAMQTGAELRGKNRQLLRFACWLEDPARIEKALARCVSDKPEDLLARVPENDLDTLHARCLLDALRGRKGAQRRFEAGLEKLPPQQRGRPTDPCHEAAVAAQLAEQTTGAKAARTAGQEALKLQREIPADFSPMWEYQALANRTLLRTGKGEKDPIQWFQQAQAAGFGVFGEWAN
ncbi:MAG: helix-turn-helix transcriptional regulator [Planctomycetes bacterium]|nr:helix-turn-helix transcriptional regulator [Planctomycetota bacterium]MCB9936465.1 helix-turn-helix transcriptional regulator [Planctomycetota bacterium]